MMARLWQIMSERTGATFGTVAANTALDALDEYARLYGDNGWADACARLRMSCNYRVDDWRIFI